MNVAERPADPGLSLVACDLDGTLLTPDHRLGEYTLCILARLRARGIEVLLASGRHYQDVRCFAGQLGGHGCLISSNGAAVHDRTGQLLDCRPLDPECVRALVRDPKLADVHTSIYRIDDWLVTRPEPRLLEYHRDSGFRYRVVGLDAIDGEGVLKVFFFGEPERLRGIEAGVQERFGARVATTFSLPVTLEIMAAGVSKGAALRGLAARRAIPTAAILAFGDGLNDLEMLAAAGTGIIMGNADPRLAADLPGLRVIGSNADESVARYLERYVLAGTAHAQPGQVP